MSASPYPETISETSWGHEGHIDRLGVAVDLPTNSVVKLVFPGYVVFTFKIKDLLPNLLALTTGLPVVSHEVCARYTFVEQRASIVSNCCVVSLESCDEPENGEDFLRMRVLYTYGNKPIWATIRKSVAIKLINYMSSFSTTMPVGNNARSTGN